MPKRISQTGSELFIVDNSEEDWKVVRYIHDWCQISKAIDVATGYFEIGSLLSLGDEWQKVDKIRILMGDEVSLRTKSAFVKGLGKATQKLDWSVENEKEGNDFLVGVQSIVEGLRSGKIECRIYRKDKFHAKAYITHARLEVVGSSALVGSSNFTFPGLNENIELNVQITGQPVAVLQEWYEQHWNEAEDVTAEILKTIDRHIRQHTPFEVYAKALQEFFRGHELTVDEWEKTKSRMYSVLDQYQREGYGALVKIARRYQGALLCDGVGLGKTFVGLMLIERLIDLERKRVVLIVPKAGRKPVWEAAIRRFLPHVGGDFSNLAIFNHTDLLRGGDYVHRFARLKETADAVVIDEAHHFRNPGLKEKSRYWRLFEVAEGKELYLLTATPINNRLIDLQHMIELFSRRKADYFRDAPLGIHSLPGHFRKMENELERTVLHVESGADSVETNQVEAEHVLANDDLFRALVVQRSRAYVKQSQVQNKGNVAIFPKREDPKVADYSIKKTYGRLLDLIERAFNKEKPLFSLAIYYPLAYYKGPTTEERHLEKGRQKEVVSLIRVQFLKRFESSAHAFATSCENLLLKLLTWVTKHSKTDHERHLLEKWTSRYEDLIGHVRQNQRELVADQEEEADEDVVTEEMLEDVEELSRDDYRIEEILDECFDDLDQLAEFLNELRQFKAAHDDKLQALKKLLKSDPVLKAHKILIFSEYMATARYLKQELSNAGIEGIDEVDSAVKRDRGEIIRQFAPYYNESSSQELAKDGLSETRVLISTDVLSEGLNLQDATRLINYDIHWNPVRLMQRIGRVDRRLNPETERSILRDHPHQKEIRGSVAYWNFLPPEELDELLRLYKKVSHKTLRISKTFGIEGKKLLTPKDDYEALKEFNHAYEGATTPVEAMHLEYQKLLLDNPGLAEQLVSLPQKVFSGKKHPSSAAQSVFFCFSLPAPSATNRDEAVNEADAWTEQAGSTKWYLYDLAAKKILEEPSEIVTLIRSTPATPRQHVLPEKTLSEIRIEVEKHITNTYFRQMDAPLGVRAKLKAWMELS